VTDQRYIRPGVVTKAFNGIVVLLTRAGLSVAGSRILTVRGRSSGRPRSTPVNLLTAGDQRYLVSPRGQTQWVRNLRAAGEGELRVGGRVERFVSTELSDEHKPAVLRSYLRRWKFEVGAFFPGLDAGATDDQLLDVAARYPVFEITT